MSLHGNQNQVVYQASTTMAQGIKEARQQVHHVAKENKNRPVRVQTVDGMVYEGIISHAEGPFLFLIVSNSQGGYGMQPHQPHSHSGGYGYPPSRGLYNQYYYNNVILPLVLFELLVIALL